MIDFKKEIISVQKENNKRVKKYNDILLENTEKIKKLFLAEQFKVSFERTFNGSIGLKLVKETETMRREREFNCFNELEKLDKVDLRSFVESRLKEFVVGVALEYDLRVAKDILIITNSDSILEIYEDISSRYQFDMSIVEGNYSNMILTYGGAQVKIRKSDDKFLRNEINAENQLVLFYGQFSAEEIDEILEYMNVSDIKMQKFIKGMDIFIL